jgi:hypothetical protein
MTKPIGVVRFGQMFPALTLEERPEQSLASRFWPCERTMAGIRVESLEAVQLDLRRVVLPHRKTFQIEGWSRPLPLFLLPVMGHYRAA